MPEEVSIVVDSVHGAIELRPLERRVIDTASFQRLRHIKQLGLGHMTYPNATHTRFAHSLGVFAIMQRVLEVAAGVLPIDSEQDLRLAALLHDIGHYPYSHLMEGVDDVVLTEERVGASSRQDAITIDLARQDPYPKHAELGRTVVTTQEDLLEAIGGEDHARQVADLFTRTRAANRQLSELIASSLDMDRVDYLLRDARAAGIPYGEIDINYLLHNLQASRSGRVGIKYKALTAAEQFLLARYFMHKAVYYHKTTFGFEEAFRQLVRRCRDKGAYSIPRTGTEVRALVNDRARFLCFTDDFLDDIARKALVDTDAVIARLARAIVFREPPKLLREECSLIDTSSEESRRHNRCSSFLQSCVSNLADLAMRFDINLGLFLLAEPKSIRVEQRPSRLPFDEARRQPPEGEDGLVKVFVPGEDEPKSLVELEESLIHHLANRSCRITRLYVLENDPAKVKRLRDAVAEW